MSVEIIQDNISNWAVIIDGPAGGPYEGGKFTVNIDFSDNYPFKCPKVQFVTKIYHPNVKTDSGQICDQDLQNSWVPTLNAAYIINTVKDLIQNPNTENPMEAEIARELMTSKDKFNNSAREFTEKYAK